MVLFKFDYTFRSETRPRKANQGVDKKGGEYFGNEIKKNHWI